MKYKPGETEVSLNHCVFVEDATISFAKDDTAVDKQGNKFHILGYSGGIMKHFFWGNVAFDLKSTKFAKKVIPVLESHDKMRRVGFTTKQKISDKIIEVEGEFLPNSLAQELKADLQAGYPMQASVMIVPLVIEHVLEGASIVVNGQKLKGPGAVFRKAIVKEVSMCSFGLDSDTKSLAASIDAGEKIKFNLLNKESDIMKVETFQEEQPVLYAEIVETAKASGEKAERDMFTELKAICGEDYELLIQCYEEGKTAQEALQLRSDKLKEANTALKAELETAQKTVKTEVKKVENPDPADQEFSDVNAEKFEDKTNLEGLEGEELYKAQWDGDKKLQKEFSDQGVYVAYCIADAKGRVNII